MQSKDFPKEYGSDQEKSRITRPAFASTSSPEPSSVKAPDTKQKMKVAISSPPRTTHAPLQPSQVDDILINYQFFSQSFVTVKGQK